MFLLLDAEVRVMLGQLHPLIEQGRARLQERGQHLRVGAQTAGWILEGAPAGGDPQEGRRCRQELTIGSTEPGHSGQCSTRTGRQVVDL
ncbi:hypothetical protein GCM10010841_30290 [Deinococcus aerophilus]|uniref:Uncharacterized protein n=1 Tax=Deinococcus aerophilus TaxID=522488 RepID=A0ABQ2H070_9DEIO|nr:hypothetical protein GCM10010841_30290 [Deinococcus aerophilus]